MLAARLDRAALPPGAEADVLLGVAEAEGLPIRFFAGGTLARDDKEGSFFQGDQFEGFQLDMDHPRGAWQPLSPAINSRAIAHWTTDEIRIVRKSFGNGPEGGAEPTIDLRVESKFYRPPP